MSTFNLVPALWRSFRADHFFLLLLAGLVLLSLADPSQISSYPSLVDWPTIAALTGLLIPTGV
jgi:di/tricarboxylate transporter